MHLWPGLAQLWLRGSWVGLAVAVGFTALANLLAAATFVWTEWLADNVRLSALGALAVVWLLSWIESRADWRRLLAELSAGEAGVPEPSELSDRWFREAQAAYLVGDWVAAEQTLLKLLKQDARDAEARLMLATLWRHQGRTEAAGQQLDQLERLESAAPWRSEISWERERIGAAGVIQEHHSLKLHAPIEQPDTTAEQQRKIAA
jgi:tetratricopeptide (TPR) repeat protein